MEPFRLVCPNCHGKLVIRHDWLLGKSIHCPRCHAVIALPAVRPVSDTPLIGTPIKPMGAHDSSAVTRVDDGTLAKQVAVETATNEIGLSELDDQAIASAIEAFRGTGGPVWSGEDSPNTDFEPKDAIPVAEATATARSVDSPPAATLDWNTPETKKRRQILMIVMAGVAGLLLALGGLGLFIVSRSAKRASVAAIDSVIEPVVESPAIDPKPPQPASTNIGPPTNASEISATPNDKPAVEDAKTPATNEPLKSDNASDAAMSTSPSSDSARPTMEPSATSAAESNSTKADTPKPPTAEPPVSLPETIEPTGDIPDSMKRFLGIFDAGNIALLPDAMTSNVPNEEVREKIDVESLYHPPAVELPIWVAARERAVYAMKFPDQPIDRFLIRLGQLTGVPIGWDVEHARFTEIHNGLIAGFSTERSELGSLIEPMFKQMGIKTASDPNGVVALRADLDIVREKLPPDWSLDDLSPAPTSISAWRDLLLRFFPKSATRWKMAGSSLEWSDDATSIEKAEVAAFLDQIRNGYALPLKSKLPDDTCSPTLGLALLDEKLSKPGKRVLLEPTTTAQIFDEAARDMDFKLIFDWPSLYSHGFSLATSDTLLLRERTWPQIARTTLDRFSLVAVADSPNRIVLTTLPQQRRMWRTLILAVEQPTTPEKLIEAFRFLAPVDVEGRSTLIASLVPAHPSKPGIRLAAVRICPPNTQQLDERDIREALGLTPKR